MINIASPVIDEEERRAVNEVIESGMLAQGPKVAELEESWAKYCGVKHALAVNSGTAELVKVMKSSLRHIALLLRSTLY